MISSPLRVTEGEPAVLSYLIALVNEYLNVTSSVEVEHDFDGELPPPVIINRENDHYDVLFPSFSFGIVSVFITFNRTVISTEPVELMLQRN